MSRATGSVAVASCHCLQLVLKASNTVACETVLQSSLAALQEPVEVILPDAMTAVAAGESHTLALSGK